MGLGNIGSASGAGIVRAPGVGVIGIALVAEGILGLLFVQVAGIGLLGLWGTAGIQPNTSQLNAIR